MEKLKQLLIDNPDIRSQLEHEAWLLKHIIAEAKAQTVEQFAEEALTEDLSTKILFRDFFEKFLLWLPPREKSDWTLKRTKSVMQSLGFLVRQGMANKNMIFGVRWREAAAAGAT